MALATASESPNGTRRPLPRRACPARTSMASRRRRIPRRARTSARRRRSALGSRTASGKRRCARAGPRSRRRRGTDRRRRRVFRARVEGTTLEHQPVALAFATLDVGMSAAGDRVDEVRIPLDHRGECLDHGLDALAGRDEAERREPEAARRERVGRGAYACRAARCDERAGAPCGTTRTFSSGHVPDSTSIAAPCRSSRSRARPRCTAPSAPPPDAAWARRAPCAESRRAAGPAPARRRARIPRRGRRRSRTRAGATRRDIEPPQHPCRSDVVGTDRLCDRRQQAAPLWARRFVHDRDEIRDLDRVRAEERASQVGRERTDPAGARRERGDDRGPHVLSAPARVDAPSACMRCGTCRPPRTEVGLPRPPLVAVRSRSSARFRLFRMMSLPLCDSPGNGKRRLCGSQNTGTLPTP